MGERGLSLAHTTIVRWIQRKMFRVNEGRVNILQERAICTIKDGYYVLPAGKLANAVTWLEMRTQSSTPLAEPLAMRPIAPDLADYRATFLELGVPWLWTRVTHLSDEELRTLFADSRNALFYAVDELDRRLGLVGLVELVNHDDGETEIAYFGLLPRAVGRGLGKRLMAGALQVAWHRAPSRIWLHTCSFDHPTALPFYIACGFVPFATGFEIMADARVSGSLPKSIAPHIPLITKPASVSLAAV